MQYQRSPLLFVVKSIQLRTTYPPRTTIKKHAPNLISPPKKTTKAKNTIYNASQKNNRRRPTLSPHRKPSQTCLSKPRPKPSRADGGQPEQQRATPSLYLGKRVCKSSGQHLARLAGNLQNPCVNKQKKKRSHNKDSLRMPRAGDGRDKVMVVHGDGHKKKKHAFTITLQCALN